MDAIDRYNEDHHLGNDNRLKATYRIAPRGYLLCNKMRYAIGTITSTSWHQWVPYVLFSKFSGFGRIFEVMGDAASQNTLDTEHFQWAYRILWRYDNLSWHTPNLESIQKYYAVKAAFYWQHEYGYVGGDPNPDVWERDKGMPSYILMHYTKDWKEHPTQQVRDFYLRNPDFWTTRNITSREMSFTDNGAAKTSYRTVYRVP